MTTITETTVAVPETTKNAPSDEIVTPTGEAVLTTTITEEVTKTTTVIVEDEPSATNTNENVPTEALPDSMDTSE